MANTREDKEMLEGLEAAAARILSRHVEAAEPWQPQDLVPWDEGRNFQFLGGQDWTPDQSTLGELGTLALTVGVLISDNVPSYHRELAKLIRSGPLWTWINRWTAEEARHAIVLRNYLMVTRAVDPVELERLRMEHMTAGVRRPELSIPEIFTQCAFESTSAMIRHRNTALLVENDEVAAICDRLAEDGESHRAVWGEYVSAALDVSPDRTVRAISARVADYTEPSIMLRGTDSRVSLAAAGIYDPLDEVEQVFTPLLNKWEIFTRTDFGPAGELARDELADFIKS
ncbi:MAG: acyl-ACP desaturase [Nocardiaceae bacterium]|nr:acyl-ACP desaturase [Nocardiaceae bacterium]